MHSVAAAPVSRTLHTYSMHTCLIFLVQCLAESRSFEPASPAAEPPSPRAPEPLSPQPQAPSPRPQAPTPSPETQPRIRSRPCAPPYSMTVQTRRRGCAFEGDRSPPRPHPRARGRPRARVARAAPENGTALRRRCGASAPPLGAAPAALCGPADVAAAVCASTWRTPGLYEAA